MHSFQPAPGMKDAKSTLDLLAQVCQTVENNAGSEFCTGNAIGSNDPVMYSEILNVAAASRAQGLSETNQSQINWRSSLLHIPLAVIAIFFRAGIVELANAYTSAYTSNQPGIEKTKRLMMACCFMIAIIATCAAVLVVARVPAGFNVTETAWKPLSVAGGLMVIGVAAVICLVVGVPWAADGNSNELSLVDTTDTTNRVVAIVLSVCCFTGVLLCYKLPASIQIIRL